MNYPQLCIDLDRAAGEARAAFAAAGARITLAQFNLLALIDANQAASQRTLCRLGAGDRSTVSTMLFSMQKRGLVWVSPDEKDRRATLVRLTQPGRTLLKRLRPVLEKASETVIEKVEGRSRASLRTALCAINGDSTIG